FRRGLRLGEPRRVNGCFPGRRGRGFVPFFRHRFGLQSGFRSRFRGLAAFRQLGVVSRSFNAFFADRNAVTGFGFGLGRFGLRRRFISGLGFGRRGSGFLGRLHFTRVLLSQQAVRALQNLVRLVKAHVNGVNQLVYAHAAQLLDVLDATIFQALRGDLVERQALANIGERRFAAGHDGFELRGGSARRFFGAADVDVPANQLGRKPDVLALLTHRQRQLIFGDRNGQLLLLEAVDLDLRDFGRRQGVGGKDRRVFAPLDDVN